jgi:hypothetical protein
MAEIFLSYKSERRHAAAHLAKLLECYGYTVWYDYHLLSGGDFAQETSQRIRQAKAVIVLWCKLAAQSEWVMREAAIAAKLGILVPARIEQCELRQGFGGNYLELSGWSGAPFERTLFPLLDAVTLRTGRPPRLDYAAMRGLDEDWFSGGTPAMTGFPLVESAQPEEEPLLLTTPLDQTMLDAVAEEVRMAQAERAKAEEHARAALEEARRPARAGNAEEEALRRREVAKLAEELAGSLWKG